MDTTTRRNFIKMTGLAAMNVPATKIAHADSAPQAIFKLGMASYTFRAFNLQQTIAMTRRLDIKRIALKSFHLPLDATREDIVQAAQAVRDAGLELYGCGVVYMNSEAEVIQAFEYARTAQMKIIIGVPSHEMLQLTNDKAQEYDIMVAIHNHGPGDALYPDPHSVYDKIKSLDKRIGLCIDVGHTQRTGQDPSEAILKYADRLYDVHIKDVSAATSEGTTVEIGRGVIDMAKLLKALISIRYQGTASFEFEKDEQDPLPGVAESVGYVKGVLSTLK